MEQLDNTMEGAIAVVGMACDLPGASNPDELWDLVASGGVAIRELSADEQASGTGQIERASNGSYVPYAGSLDDFDTFDAGFFGIGPRDAALMDPQHRKFMECVWTALEDGGVVPSRFDGSIGIYAGSGLNGYLLRNLLSNPEILEQMGMFLLRHTSNDKDFLSTTVSYRLNLKGPSVNVQTACSTSLVAVHLASQALLAGECDVAVAGGVTIEVPHGTGYVYREGEVLSPDGFCRAFEQRSAGTVLSSGVVAVTLRRALDAIREGDPIHALIRGTAINNDGSGKVGFLAPSVDGHSRVVREALAVAGVTADSIQLLEAHGTGTSVGDPIEVAALTEAFRADTEERQFCRLVSTKPNIGHTDTAAGVASLIKAVQALKHRTLPPLANYESPNPLLELETSPFYLSSQASPWTVAPNAIRRAGVSSLGVGGTNAHVVVEEYETPMSASKTETSTVRPVVIPLSAKSPAALARYSEALAGRLESDERLDLADVSFTFQQAREQFEYRRAVVAQELKAAVGSLRSEPRRQPERAARRPRLAFLFPGGGAQYPAMGRDLYDAEPVFRASVAECAAILRKRFEFDIVELLYGAHDRSDPQHVAELQRTTNSLVTVFVVEYALTKLLGSWGIHPDALLGHSLGEYTAACVSGVLTLEDALQLVVTRGQLIECVPEGGMVSVALPEAEVRKMLPSQLDIAVVNSDALCVVTGPREAVEDFSQYLDSNGVEWRRVNIKAPGHSAMLDPILERFREVAKNCQFGNMSIPFLSNTTGTWAQPGEAADAEYWVRHLRHTVRFADDVEALLADGDTVVLEVGPGQTLGGLTTASARPPAAAVSCMRRSSETTDDQVRLLEAVGQLWEAGVEIDWQSIHQSGRRVNLPTYPFEKQRHWIAPGPGSAAHGSSAPTTHVGDWFWRATWLRAGKVSEDAVLSGRWLVIGTESSEVRQWSHRIEKNGGKAIQVSAGPSFHRSSAYRYAVDLNSAPAIAMLAADLEARALRPDRIVILAFDRSKSVPRQSFLTLLRALRELRRVEKEAGSDLSVVTEGAFNIFGDGGGNPSQAALAATIRVANSEASEGAVYRLIDIQEGSPNSLLALNQIADHPDERIVAIRRSEAWLPTFRQVHDRPVEGKGLREGGTYLITGGTSGIGLALARHLASTVRANLVLLSRTAFPPPEDWAAWASYDGPTPAMAETIRTLKAIESEGSVIRTVACDVTDPGQLGRAVSLVQRELGAIQGVFHAAGRLDDGLIAQKSDAEACAVLAPKVEGLDTLLEAFADVDLDFMCLFSSVSAFAGVPGQADYAYANAYMDAVAASGAHPFPVYSIQWSAWNEVGMLAAPSIQRRVAPNPATGSEHSWDGTAGKMIATDEAHALASTSIRSSDWVVAEHRTADGLTLVPGTAFLGMMLDMASRITGSMALRDIQFSSALILSPGETSQIRTVARKSGGTTNLSVSSWSASDGRWVEHASASINPAPIGPASRTAQVPFPAIDLATPVATQPDAMHFGPRWHSVVAYAARDAIAVGRIALTGALREHDENISFHPALLDLGIGFGLKEFSSAGFTRLYVPAAFGEVEFFQQLPHRFESVSYLRSVPAEDLSTAIFDVDFVNENRQLIATLRDVVFTEIESAGELSTADSGAGSSGETRRTAARGLGGGILADDGMQALELILRSGVPGPVVASPVEPDAIGALLNPANSGSKAVAVSIDRSVTSNYEPPSNDLERYLTDQWQGLLGVRQVGVHDNFFDLGGQSLLALRLAGAVRRDLGLHLPLAMLLEAPTIRGLSTILSPSKGKGTQNDGNPLDNRWRSLVPIQTGGNKRPLFCIHGMNGNVLNFREISNELGPEQPFYGLQARGLNERDCPSEQIEEMAAEYIAEIRSLQPKGPYQLAGYSGGGLVAFDMARQLVVSGEDVSLLAMLDTFTPSYMAKSQAQRISLFLRGVREGGPGFLASWAAKNRAGKQAITNALPEPTGPVGDAFVRAQSRYQPAVLPLRIVLLRATERAERGYVPPDLGWSEHTSVGVEVWNVPGGHESMCVRPNVSSLAACLRTYITAES